MQAVSWSLRDALSYRDIEEMLLERGLTVDHSTINRWVAPSFLLIVVGTISSGLPFLAPESQIFSLGENMFKRPTLILLSAATLAGGILASPTAALADPPWARGDRSFRHGGPPAWAPAHGWRRHHESYGFDRPYRSSRFYEERRYGGYRDWRY